MPDETLVHHKQWLAPEMCRGPGLVLVPLHAAACCDLDTPGFLVQPGDPAFHLGRGQLLRVIDLRISKEQAVAQCTSQPDGSVILELKALKPYVAVTCGKSRSLKRVAPGNTYKVSTACTARAQNPELRSTRTTFLQLQVVPGDVVHLCYDPATGLSLADVSVSAWPAAPSVPWAAQPSAPPPYLLRDLLAALAVPGHGPLYSTRRAQHSSQQQSGHGVQQQDATNMSSIPACRASQGPTASQAGSPSKRQRVGAALLTNCTGPGSALPALLTAPTDPIPSTAPAPASRVGTCLPGRSSCPPLGSTGAPVEAAAVTPAAAVPGALSGAASCPVLNSSKPSVPQGQPHGGPHPPSEPLHISASAPPAPSTSTQHPQQHQSTAQRTSIATSDTNMLQRWTPTEAVKAAMAARPPAPAHPPAFQQYVQVGRAV
jgi:hypothetical protein